MRGFPVARRIIGDPRAASLPHVIHPEFAMIFESLAKNGHEEVVFCHNADAGLKAIIAIHNSVLGPALGGLRKWNYANEQEALNEILADGQPIFP